MLHQGGAVLLVPTPCMLVGGWSVKNFGKNQKYFSTFGHYWRDILRFLEHKISNLCAARAKNWIELPDMNKIFFKIQSFLRKRCYFPPLNVKYLRKSKFIGKTSIKEAKTKNFREGSGVLRQKLSLFLNCTEILLVRLLGVGGSLPKILAIF